MSNTGVIIRFHYKEDSEKYRFRFNFFKNNLLKNLLAQTDQDFDIYIRCYEWQKQELEALDPKIKTFHVTYEEEKYTHIGKKYFYDFVSYQNTLGLPKFDLQISIDSDEIIVPDYIKTIKRQVDKHGWTNPKSLHIHLQPDLIDSRTGKKYDIGARYSKDHGSAFFAVYQGKKQKENDYLFVNHNSHTKFPKLCDVSVLLPKGFCWACVHDFNESTHLPDEKGYTGLTDKDDNVLQATWSRLNNFGDVLTPHVLEYFTGKRVEYVDPRTNGKILGCGSIMQFVRPNDTVIGTGIMRFERYGAPGIKVLATRGPISAYALTGKTDIPYGDMGILLPRMYNPDIKKIHKVGYIPHYVDQELCAQQNPGAFIINLMPDSVDKNWRDVVDQILSCETVVSSSLHGIIVAEAYGIPAQWAVYTDELIGGELKFQDWYLATGRGIQKPFTDIPLPDLTEMQNRLISQIKTLQ